MENARASLLHIDEHDLIVLPLDMARRLAEDLGVRDNGFDGPQDMRDRLLLMKRKMVKSQHRPYAQFSKAQAKAAAANRHLLEMERSIKNIFDDKSMDGKSSLLTGALSDVLVKEKLLTKQNLLDEFSDRMRVLRAKITLIIIAGETNSGKSTFLNVLLGINILPTDVLHCTYAVCKIVYSHSYIIETLDYEGHCKEYYCDDCEEAQAKLREVVTCDNFHKREQHSAYKEITLKMPAEILKSGITLVDTPGIGENEAMDDVTINFVREAQASAFIYIIKSDGAGGVQEDRLGAFLKAVQENYKNDRLEGTFDPQAAMFVCHRWDSINPSETEKVKRNALMKLEMVWPGFQASQTYLFSSKKTMLHLDVDPDYITDSFNDLLNGLKQLIDRATHNAIKYQYCWLKTFLQPACRHLRVMISQCTKGKKDLDDHFRDVAKKQEQLMKTSHDHIPLFEKKVASQKAFLKSKIKEILSLADVRYCELDDYEILLSTCEEDKYLQSSENRRRLDHQIVNCLIKHCDDYLLREDILKTIEDCILQEIIEHLGFFENQAHQIKIDMQGAETRRPGSLANLAASMNKFTLDASQNSKFSSFDIDEHEEATIPDPVILSEAVTAFLQSKKSGRKPILSSKPKFGPGVLGILGGGNPYADPKSYLEKRIGELASAVCKDESMIDGFVSRYLQFSERCIAHAIKCIPQFIAVNNELMNTIRQHREVFQKEKQFMKEVMEKLEPHRVQLQGYGYLYMEDVHADQINFNVDRRGSSVQLQPGLNASIRPYDDSGFVGSGSCRSRTREIGGHSLVQMMFGILQKCFWTHIQNARINVDGSPMSVTIKTYCFIPDDSMQYSEIAALRCLEHKNVASFFGMTQIDGANADEDDTKPAPVLPAFIFKGQLWTAKVYRRMKLINSQDFVRTFLMELWQGLDFIHMEHLVHLELNLDTVMVDSQSGTVKLCQQCKPREAQLPVDLSCKTNAAVCLSPSVLQGNVYQIADDIYAYGLLLWELLYPENLPYTEQRSWTLERFIDEVHPSKMLSPALESLGASPAVETILNGCLICTKGTIITMQDISRFREDIFNDPRIASIRSHRSKPLERNTRSNSSDSDGTMSRQMSEPNPKTPATDTNLRRMSEPFSTINDRNLQQPLIVPIQEEILSESKAKTTAQQKPQPRRPSRHSVVTRPDLGALDIPDHHKDSRRFSAPVITVTGGTQTQVDYEESGPKRKEKPKKGKLEKGKATQYDPLERRRQSTGLIPAVKVDPPEEEERNFCRSSSVRSIHRSAATIDNNFIPSLQLQRQTMESSATEKCNQSMIFSTENNSAARGAWSIFDSLKNCSEEDSIDGSVGHSGDDFPVQNQSVPVKNLFKTPSGHTFGRQRNMKQLRRSDALRHSPTFRESGNTFPERTSRRNTDGEIKPLSEDRFHQRRSGRSQTFTFGCDDQYDDVSFSLKVKGNSESEIANDPTQA